jgi:plastocyanin
MKRVIQAVALAGLAALTVACSSGSGSTPAPSSASSPGTSAPAGSGTTIVAKDTAFNPTSVTIAADTATQITLDNQDSAPHNIAIKDASGAQVFKGDIQGGQGKITYDVNALPAGAYSFWCEVHPNMTGTLTVQ